MHKRYNYSGLSPEAKNSLIGFGVFTAFITTLGLICSGVQRYEIKKRKEELQKLKIRVYDLLRSCLGYTIYDWKIPDGNAEENVLLENGKYRILCEVNMKEPVSTAPSYIRLGLEGVSGTWHFFNFNSIEDVEALKPKFIKKIKELAETAGKPMLINCPEQYKSIVKDYGLYLLGKQQQRINGGPDDIIVAIDVISVSEMPTISVIAHGLLKDWYMELVPSDVTDEKDSDVMVVKRASHEVDRIMDIISKLGPIELMDDYDLLDDYDFEWDISNFSRRRKMRTYRKRYYFSRVNLEDKETFVILCDEINKCYEAFGRAPSYKNQAALIKARQDIIRFGSKFGFTGDYDTVMENLNSMINGE